MKLIIGGAYQGKLSYAQNAFGITAWADGRICAYEEVFYCQGIHHFHLFIKRFPDAGIYNRLEKYLESGLVELENISILFAQQLYKNNPDIVIVSNELGYGVVPMEETDRLWRERTGRICTELGALSEEVIRVICGIGIRIK